MTDDKLMQIALNALEECYDVQAYPANGETIQDDAIKALRARLAQPETYPENFIDALRFEAALAQPEPEPVAWWHDRGDVVDLNVSGHGTPLYFAPPKKEWVGLTDAEREEATGWSVEHIEAKLKDKNENSKRT